MPSVIDMVLDDVNTSRFDMLYIPKFTGAINTKVGACILILCLVRRVRVFFFCHHFSGGFSPRLGTAALTRVAYIYLNKAHPILSA